MPLAIVLSAVDLLPWLSKYTIATKAAIIDLINMTKLCKKHSLEQKRWLKHTYKKDLQLIR